MLLAAAVTCLIQSLPVQSAVQDHSLVNHGGPWPVARNLGKRRSIGATQWPPQWPRGMKTRRHLELLKDTSRQLQNAPVRECDPTKVLSDGSGADLGILTCSEGQYCVESMESSLGGYCTDILVPMEGRKLQGNDSSNSDLFDYAYNQFCPTVITAYGMKCTCTNADREASTLDIQCSMEKCNEIESQCSVNLTTCYVDEASYKGISPNAGNVSKCTTYSEPYYQKTCYNYTNSDIVLVNGAIVNYTKTDRSLDFNGVTCNSYYLDDEGDPFARFDCTNTEGNHSGSWYDRETNLIYSVFAKTYGCAENCNICGDGFEVTKPSQVITDVTSEAREADSDFTCGALSDQGMSGNLTTAQCEDMPDMIFEACGCMASEGTTPPPSDGTSPAPTSEATIVGLLALGVSLAVSAVAFAY